MCDRAEELHVEQSLADAMYFVENTSRIRQEVGLTDGDRSDDTSLLCWYSQLAHNHIQIHTSSFFRYFISTAHLIGNMTSCLNSVTEPFGFINNFISNILYVYMNYRRGVNYVLTDYIYSNGFHWMCKCYFCIHKLFIIICCCSFFCRCLYIYYLMASYISFVWCNKYHS